MQNSNEFLKFDKDTIVIPSLYGRMGNQLFQIATAIAYARKHICDYHIPAHTANDAHWPPVIKHLENPKYIAGVDMRIVGEQIHAYHEIEFREGWRGSNIRLDGYWQSYKYFENIPDIKEILFPEPQYQYQLLITQEAQNSIKDFVAIHVRRGDYLDYPKKHPVVTIEYIATAINTITALTNRNWKYIFFSDDIPWCRENFINKLYSPILQPETYFFSENQSPIEDFKMMMACQHNIIANSSFSWWAAYLNPNPDKIIVTPDEDNWFGPDNKHLDVKDLLPPSWIQIKY